MILTVTPNACVDKTYRVETFRLNRVNRPSHVYTVAGGKGLNVARVFRTLGGQPTTTGLLGGINGQIVTKALKSEGIADAFLRVKGETRVCIAVIDPDTRTQTEINEPGPQMTPREARKLFCRVERLLSEQSYTFLVLSGSLPPGLPAGIYADLIDLANRLGIKSVLDSSGEPLREGLTAQPWMVKPNVAELEWLLGYPLPDEAALLSAARILNEKYAVAMAAITRGEEGAILSARCGPALSCWKSVPSPIDFVSAVASGDCFTAAFLWSWTYGPHPEDPTSALRLATGAGAANAAVLGAGFCSRESIHTLAASADVHRIDC